MAKRRKTAKRTAGRKKSSHPGYYPSHIAMAYRLGGAGIVIIAELAIVFIVKGLLNS